MPGAASENSEMIMFDREKRRLPEAMGIENVRPRRLIGISLLPSACTLGNLLCGVVAIFLCLLAIRADYGGFPQNVFRHKLEQLFPTYIAAGAYLIVLAMIFDALDGRLARITRRTSEFGAQLDSLSDIVSFGVAPVMLFITLLLRPVADGGEREVSPLLLRVGIACGLIYVSCAAIRLARYNAENVKSESAQKKFSGLPSPGAAAAVVALLALHEDLRHTGFVRWDVDWANVSRWVIAGSALVLGLLMVTRLDYVHVFNVYVRRKQPPWHLFLVAGLGVLAWYWFELLLVVAAFGYVLSGLAMNVRHWWRGETRVAPAETGGTLAPGRTGVHPQ
jgi:CDP-diacylglycerol--serine O-phosphatidyltransferase